MDRRTFIGTFAGAVLAAPLTACEQPLARAPRLGILRLSPPRASYENAFLESLRDLGYVDGKNLVIVDRNAGGDIDGLPALAAELVRLPVTVIFARGAQALAAAKHATDTIPIVAFDDTIDPVQSGYAASLARPGGNVTGVFQDMPELAWKWLQLLADLVPRLVRVAVFWDPTTGSLQRDAVQSSARALGKELQLHEIREVSGFPAAFMAAARAHSDALLILSSPVMRINSKTIADFSLQVRLVAISPYRDFPEMGGLMSYGAYLPAWFQHCAVQLVKILRGAKAGEVPVERPDRFEFVLNSKVAKALNLTIPQSVLLRADEVIQ